MQVALDHRRLSRALAGCSLGQQIVHLESTGSTNADAVALGEQGYPHGVVVSADEQTAGRGRRGAVWESPACQNLYLSVLLRPKLAHDLWPRLTTVIALALCRAVEDQCGTQIKASIKWPNDIYLGDRKLAGILCETGRSSDGHFAVAGAGINVFSETSDFPPELRGIATSLTMAASEADFSRESVAAAYIQELARLLPLVESDYQREVLREVSDRSYLLGKKVMWVTEAGTFEGFAMGLDPEGRLLVRHADGQPDALSSVELIRPVV